jgi:hypothetical protein
MKSIVRGVFSIGILVVAWGCASTSPPPTLQTGPQAEVSHDGLVRVDNAVLPVAYLKPNMDLKPYTRFMLDPVEVAYQKDPGNSSSPQIGVQSGNYSLSRSQMETMKEVFRESVVEALTEDNGYELTTEPGPDVLRISAALIDLVVSVPTEMGGRGGTYARSYGMVTLVLEVRDSQSGEIFARAADRRDPTRNTDIHLASVNPGLVRRDVTILFEYWADLVRERLDAVRAM